MTILTSKRWKMQTLLLPSGRKSGTWRTRYRRRESSDEELCYRTHLRARGIRTADGVASALSIRLPCIEEVRRECRQNVAPPPRVDLKRSANAATSTLHIRLQPTLKRSANVADSTMKFRLLPTCRAIYKVIIIKQQQAHD